MSGAQDEYLARLRRSFDSDEPRVAPRFAMFNVVRRCNAGCLYCDDWKNSRDPRTDPSAATIKDILDFRCPEA